LSESTDDSSDWNKNAAVQTKDSEAVAATAAIKGRRRRFASETVNDLLFWGAHLMVVGISLAIMWVKFDAMGRGLKDLLKAQNTELDIARGEALKADQAYESARKAEQQRSVDVRGAQTALSSLVEQVATNQSGIKVNQDSIRNILDTVNETNQLVLKASQEAEAAAIGSEHAAQEAAGGARLAAGAAGAAARQAGAAAATSGRTASVVASKVATQSDKAQIRAQQRALAVKQKQLSRTIQRVKKQGPTFWDRLLH
jgi:hypothetical protein